MFRTMKLVQFQ